MRFWCCYCKHILHIFLVFLLVILKKQVSACSEKKHVCRISIQTILIQFHLKLLSLKRKLETEFSDHFRNFILGFFLELLRPFETKYSRVD